MKITRWKRFHGSKHRVWHVFILRNSGLCTQREEGKKTRTKGGSLASVIPELENCVACEGSRKKGGKAALVVGGSGRCQGQIQLLTPENTETVITETRETVDRPLCLHPLTLPLQESFSFAPPFFTRASRIRRSSTISDLLFSESSSTWEEKKKKKEKNVDQGNWSGYFGSTLAELNGFALWPATVYTPSTMGEKSEWIMKGCIWRVSFWGLD